MTKNREWTLLLDNENCVRETIPTILSAVRLKRKPAEDARFKKQQRVSAAPEIATLGTWEYDLVTSLISCDERGWEILGLTEDQSVSAEEVFKMVYPEDREKVRKRVRESLVQQGAGIYAIEYRNLRTDGTVNWVVVHAMRGKEITERPPRLFGTILDITQEKQAEEAIRKALDGLERRIRDLAAEHGIPLQRVQDSDRPSRKENAKRLYRTPTLSAPEPMLQEYTEEDAEVE